VTAQRFEFESELFEWQARVEKWVFAALPDDVSHEIRDVPRPRAGFDSVKVVVTLGGSRWRTSIFPQSAEGVYVVPVKRSVRDAEGVDTGDRVRIAVETLD
jgi:hypothetical protein